MIKKFLPLAAIALCLLSFESCKKCKDCNYLGVSYMQEPGEPEVEMQRATVQAGELCGDDLEAVDGKTLNSTITSGGATIRSEQRWTCK